MYILGEFTSATWSWSQWDFLLGRIHLVHRNCSENNLVRARCFVVTDQSSPVPPVHPGLCCWSRRFLVNQKVQSGQDAPAGPAGRYGWTRRLGIRFRIIFFFADVVEDQQPNIEEYVLSDASLSTPRKWGTYGKLRKVITYIYWTPQWWEEFP